uniref:Calmin n=2 Tax=Nothobranchius kadleci TaxID=1051664 RepID=A0A1A8DSM3_NOTKA
MAGHDWKDWFEREELIGQISDIRVQNLQVEREVVQKRTFTRWMNLHLEKCDPPFQVQDLFQDIQDGHVLMALLEELSGCRLLHNFKRSSHRIFRLNNIAKVLSFLEERNVKLVSIDAADIADGNSSIILGLLWNIILFFQIKELTGNIRSQFPSSSSLSSIPTSSDSSVPSEEKPSVASTMRDNGKAIKKLLHWVQRRTRKYGVAVQDFGKSWTSGLAFLAVIKSIDSSLVDLRKSLLRSPRENLEDAFRIAHYSLGIPRLLEPEDVTINTPDEQSIIMYVSQFLEHFPGEQETPEQSQLMERSVSMGRLNFRDGHLDHMRSDSESSTVRQRSKMFQSNSNQHPPKVLISSVSEDRDVLLPRLKVAAARSWSSEDFLTDSTHMGDISNSANLKDQTIVVPEDSARDSVQQNFTHSPSSVPKSVVGDSAINSPDSWVESELMPESFSDSYSDGSLWDSGMAWEVYRATPVEVTPVDEGFISSIEDRAPDGQSMTESFMDEGMSSISSNQERIHVQTQEEELENQGNLERSYQDLGTDLTSDQKESFTQQMEGASSQKDQDITAESLPTSSGPESLTADPVIWFNPRSTEPPSHEGNCFGGSPLKKQEKDENEEDGQISVLGESPGQERPSPTSEGREPDSPPEDEGKEARSWSEAVDARTDVAVGEQYEDLLRNSTYCEENRSETLNDSYSTKKKKPSKTSLNIPLISITSEPEEDNQEPEPDPGGTDQEEHEGLTQKCIPDVQSPHSAEEMNHGRNEVPAGRLELMGYTENQHLDDGRFGACSDEVGEDFQKERSAGEHPQEERAITARGPSLDTLNQRVDPDEDQDKVTSSFSEPETQNSQRNILDPVNLQHVVLDPTSFNQNSQVGTSCSDSAGVPTNMDWFYSDPGPSSVEDLVGDGVEPMDLFYPNEEELMVPEPSDAEMQRWPSVLSVSALQPAPVSDGPEDQQLGEDMLDGEDLDCLIDGANHHPADPPSNMDQCVLCGVAIGPPGRSESLRSKLESCSKPSEIQIAPVLRHRKGSRLSDSMNHQSTGPRSAEEQDVALWWKENMELVVLLLLWLLVYSIMLLKELDLMVLPSIMP